MADPVPGAGQEKSMGKASKALNSLDYNISGSNFDVSLKGLITGSAQVTDAGAIGAGQGIADVANGLVAPHSFDEMSGFRTQTVLCTELYKQGVLDEETYKKDVGTTQEWLRKRPFLKAGYLSAAHWPLWLLRNKKKFAKKYMHHVVKAMSEYYADIQTDGFKFKKKNIVGYLIVLFGLTMIAPVGIVAKISRNKNYRLLLSTLVFIIWFFPLLTFSIMIKFINKIKEILCQE